MVGGGSCSTLTQINVWICPEVRDEGGQPSSSSIIHQCAELQTAHRGGRAALHLTSACFCLHMRAREQRGERFTRYSHLLHKHDQLRSRRLQRRRRAVRPEPGRPVQSRSCNQTRGGTSAADLAGSCIVCAVLNFPEEPTVSSRARKNIMKLKISSGFFFGECEK